LHEPGADQRSSPPGCGFWKDSVLARCSLCAWSLSCRRDKLTSIEALYMRGYTPRRLLINLAQSLGIETSQLFMTAIPCASEERVGLLGLLSLAGDQPIETMSPTSAYSLLVLAALMGVCNAFIPSLHKTSRPATRAYSTTGKMEAVREVKSPEDFDRVGAMWGRSLGTRRVWGEGGAGHMLKTAWSR
jgi:hypothetical protein